jgi:hypothetical protein
MTISQQSRRLLSPDMVTPDRTARVGIYLVSRPAQTGKSFLLLFLKKKHCPFLFFPATPQLAR